MSNPLNAIREKRWRRRVFMAHCGANPSRNAVNRRISIVVMNKRTEAAISQENGNLLSVQHAAPSSPLKRE
jgi:hypothetical protein